MRGEKETKFANHERFNSFSASLPLFLGKDPGFCTRDSPSSLPWTGVGWGVSTHRSPQCGNHAGVVSWSLLPSHGNQGVGWVSTGPPKGRTSQVPGRKGAPGSWAGVPSLTFLLRRTLFLLSTPGFKRFQRQSLRKRLSWQQLQPIGARL